MLDKAQHRYRLQAYGVVAAVSTATLAALVAGVLAVLLLRAQFARLGADRLAPQAA